MISDCELQYQELLCTNVCILSQSVQFLVKEDCLFGKTIPQANLCYCLETLTKQFKSLSLEKVRTTAVHLWKEILETVVTKFCCLLKKCCSLYDFKIRR